jgi:alpha-L-arabinofuranosidase
MLATNRPDEILSTRLSPAAEPKAAENTVDTPDAVRPHETSFATVGADFNYVFPPYSFTLLRLPPAGSR